MSSRKKRRFELNDLVNNQHSNNEEEDGQIKEISFQNGETSLVLKKPLRYYTANKCDYDESLIDSSQLWHQIIICHEKKFNFESVLPELYKAVGDEFFAPIAHCSSLNTDYFFVHNQGGALRRLFANNLRIQLGSNHVDLMVKFGVANFKKGNLTPREKLASVIKKSIKPTTPLVMTLGHLAGSSDLNDIKLSLSNKSCLRMLCSQLSESQNFLQNIQTLALDSNEITSLQPFTALRSQSLRVLNLQFNKIEDVEEFSWLNHLNLHVLFLIGNPVTKISLFKENIRKFLPNLKKIDDANIDFLEKSNTFLTTSSFDNRIEEISEFNAEASVIRQVDVDDHMKKEFHKRENNSWNRVVVEHMEKVSKETIIDEMNKQFFDQILFFPCYYKRNKKTDSFYLFKNFSALRALVQNNLVMKISSHNCEVKFELHLKCAEWMNGQISWPQKLNYVVKKRIEGSKLNLDFFSSDSDLKQLTVLLSSSSCINYILQTAISINQNTISISLRGNKMSNVENLKNLSSLNFPKLVSLDLTNNTIKSLVNCPKLPNIIELYVDKNPVCVKYYEEPWKFIKDLRESFPNLQYVDKRRIDKSTTVFMRNYLFSSGSYTLIEYFVKFFLQLYDSCIRKSLKEFYDNESLFTMSKMNGAFNEETSRNLLYDEDNTEKVHVGSENITNFFESLPKTTHDFATLCVDVPLTTEKNILLTVTGFFKVSSDSINRDDIIEGFTRTFFLERQEKKAGTMRNTFNYRIKNEQLTIYGISADVSIKIFKKNIVTEFEIGQICQALLPLKSEEEEAKILLLKEVTQLKENYCKRFLMDANWNVKKALYYFNLLIDREILCLEDFDLKNE